MEIECIDCQKVRFSLGGHVFAVATGSTIHVYPSYEMEQTPLRRLYMFDGHTAPLTTLMWCSNDIMLYSAGKDGKIYGWSLITRSKSNKLNAVLCSSNYISIVKSKFDVNNVNRLAACSADGFLFEVSWNESTNDSPQMRQVSNPSSPSDQITALCLGTDEQFLFAGTASGDIWIY